MFQRRDPLSLESTQSIRRRGHGGELAPADPGVRLAGAELRFIEKCALALSLKAAFRCPIILGYVRRTFRPRSHPGLWLALTVGALGACGTIPKVSEPVPTVGRVELVNCRAWTPLPEDLQVDEPGAGVAATLRGFAGIWNGTWDDPQPQRRACTALVVEQIDAEGFVQLVYSFGTPNSERGALAGYYRGNGQIRAGVLEVITPWRVPLRYTLHGDGTLRATRGDGGPGELQRTDVPIGCQGSCAEQVPVPFTEFRYRNPPGTPKAARNFSLGETASLLWRRYFLPARVSELPKGHTLERNQARASLDQYAGGDSVTWIGHAAFLLRIGGKMVLTDPYLSEYASPLGAIGVRRFAPPGIALEDLPAIDVLIVSHNHYDHLDVEAIEALAGKERMVVIVPPGLGSFFTERGYTRVRELDWHQRLELEGVAITALPAIHSSRRDYGDINRSLWMGAMIESGTSRVYFSGDTGYGPVFAELGERYGPFDLALVPIGGYAPEAVMKAAHTNPEDAVALALDLRAETLLGHHWGTVVLTDEPPFEPPGRFRAAGRAAGLSEDRLWLLRIGETRPLPRRRAPGAAGGPPTDASHPSLPRGETLDSMR